MQNGWRWPSSEKRILRTVGADLISRTARFDVWVTGRYQGTDGAWEIIGIFSTEREALAACLDGFCFVQAIPFGARRVMPEKKSGPPFVGDGPENDESVREHGTRTHRKDSTP